MKYNEDHIIHFIHSHDFDQLAKIQCFVATINNYYLEEGMFGISNGAILNCNSIQRTFSEASNTCP